MFTVLIAESNSSQNSYIYRILQHHFSEDCTLYTAGSRQDILTFLDQNRTDVLMMDMQIPGLSHQNIATLLQNKSCPCAVLPIESGGTFNPANYPNHAAIVDYLLTPFSESELILTLETVFQMCRQFHFSRRNFDPGDASRNDIIKNKIQRYIANHYHEIISMQDVAHAMNYSETHFCRLFKQYFHVNFSAYLNELRVFHAKELLTHSNHTIKDIGYMCGYRDTSYFIRVFKRINGLTPSDYRIQQLTRIAKKSNES